MLNKKELEAYRNSKLCRDEEMTPHRALWARHQLLEAESQEDKEYYFEIAVRGVLEGMVVRAEEKRKKEKAMAASF